MKKLYRKGTVHPSPPIISDHLSFLPATILTLTAALSPEDREVLAYLISCASNNNNNNNISVNGFQGQRKNNVHQQQKSVSFAKSRSSSGNNNNNDHDHPPLFTCDCFRCYMSYWVRWDSSPNRQLIHEIIDAVEDELLHKNNKKMKNNKKDKKKRGGNDNNSGDLKRNNINDHGQSSLEKEHHHLATESESVQEINRGDRADHHHHERCREGNDQEKGSGSVRSFVSFIGERIWSVWG